MATDQSPIDPASIKADIDSLTNQLNEFIHEDQIKSPEDVGDIIEVITIGGSIFAAKGDISVIGGQPKAGKTSTAAFILATALMPNIPDGFDSLGIRATYCKGLPVVYIDTEQPPAYTAKVLSQVRKILGVTSTPQNLGIVNLRKYGYKTKLEKVLEMIGAYPQTHLWIIDGLADVIRNPNDIDESFGVIEQMMIIAETLNTTIILYIHENPGNGTKLRGNLGSEAERKCGGAITIKKHKDKGVHSIEPKLIRGSKDFDPIFFQYSSDQSRMVSLSPAASAELGKKLDKTQLKFDSLVSMAKQCLRTGGQKYRDLIDSVMAATPEIEGKPISSRTAENRIKAMKQNGIISINGEYYGLTEKYIPQP